MIVFQRSILQSIAHASADEGACVGGRADYGGAS